MLAGHAARFRRWLIHRWRDRYLSCSYVRGQRQDSRVRRRCFAYPVPAHLRFAAGSSMRRAGRLAVPATSVAACLPGSRLVPPASTPISCYLWRVREGIEQANGIAATTDTGHDAYRANVPLAREFARVPLCRSPIGNRARCVDRDAARQRCQTDKRSSRHWSPSREWPR